MTSASTSAHKDRYFHIFYIFIYSNTVIFFYYFLSFVIYHKFWSDWLAEVGLTDHTGPLLASDLVN